MYTESKHTNKIEQELRDAALNHDRVSIVTMSGLRSKFITLMGDYFTQDGVALKRSELINGVGIPDSDVIEICYSDIAKVVSVVA